MKGDWLLREVDTLVDLLRIGAPVRLGAIPWASPVVAFGNPAVSKIATLGLNPSNLEFMDSRGNQLLAPANRLESLATLKIRGWGELARQGVRQVWQACEEYFYRNPYNQWFGRLEKLLVETGSSYYTRIGDTACHLDLVPFATATKWSELSGTQRSRLIELGAPSLVRVLLASNIRVLILNGATVVREFGQLLGKQVLRPCPMPSWALQRGRVLGIAYIGQVSRLGGVDLDRELVVLGYNHNIQSSYGMTTDVVCNMASWVGRTSLEAIA